MPLLESVKNSLANRGWVFYENQMAQIIDDVRLMTQDTLMASSLTWQVERQLQDFYSQLLSTVETLDSQIGLQHLPMPAIRKMKRCGKRACMLKISSARLINISKPVI